MDDALPATIHFEDVGMQRMHVGVFRGIMLYSS